MSTKTNEAVKNQQATETGLATISRSAWLALQDGSELREAIEANFAGGEAMTESILTRVGTPGAGGTMWTINTPEGEKTVKEIEGILVHHCPRGVLWPSIDPVPGTMPVAVSHDLKTAEQFGPVPKDMEANLKLCEISPKVYDWKKVSQIYGVGAASREMKRAKDQRGMFILTKDSARPLVVPAQPGSLKTVVPVLLKLTKVPWRCIISLSLKKENNRDQKPYSQIIPRVVGFLSKEDGEIVKATYTDPIKAMSRQLLTEDLDNSDE